MFIGSYEGEKSFRVEIDEVPALIYEATTNKIARRGVIDNFLAALRDFPLPN